MPHLRSIPYGPLPLQVPGSRANHAVLWPGMSNAGTTRMPRVARVFDNVANFFPAYKQTVEPLLVQPGKFSAFLRAESLIIGKMPVKDVHLHGPPFHPDCV